MTAADGGCMTAHVRTRKTAGLSDEQLSDLAGQYAAKRAMSNQIAEEANELATAMQKELDRRRAEVVEVKGWRIKKRFSTIRSQDIDILQREATPSLFKKLTKVIIDKAAWNAAIKLGDVSQDLLDAVETEKLSAPWIELKAL